MTAIRVELELDDGSFTTRMLRAGQSLERFEQQAGGTVRSINALQSSSQGFLATLRDVTVVLGQASAAISFVRSVTTGWVHEIIKVNAEFERLRTLLAGMSKAADPLKEATQQLKEMRDFARNTPYSLQAITGVFTQMKGAGIDPMKGSLQGLVDAVASFGGSEEVMKRASLAISQMSGKGVIQMEELRQQLGEAVPRATELMARSMGVTYGQLVKQISTGTVESQRALQLLNAEFTRTFGGSAQAQMDTWNGLMARFTTQMQNLAEGTGEAGFFEAAKRGARELIALLESPAIAGLRNKDGGVVKDGLAQQLGNGLTATVGYIDSAIRKVIEFRSEILAAGEVLVYAFGATKALQALNALGGGLGNAAQQVRILNRELGVARAEFGVAALAFQGAGTRLEGFTSISRGVALGLRGIMVAAIELAPIIALVGMAVMAAASYFDVFGKKAKEARDDVLKFGGQASKESLDLFKKGIKEQEAELDRLIAKRNRLNGIRQPAGNARATGDVVYGAQIKNVERQVAEDRKTLADATSIYEGDAAERAAQTRIRALDNETLSKRRALDRQGKDMADAQDKLLARLSGDRKSTEKAQQDYADAEKARQLSVYDVQIEVFQRAYDKSKEQLSSLTGDRLRQEEAFTSFALKNLAELQAARKQAAESPMGVPKTSRLVDEERLLEKGQKALANIQASITGLRAGLAGASVEVFELQQKLADGKFGPVDSGKVQELINQLLQAQAEKNKLDELFEGKTKFDKEVASGTLKAQQDLFEAQTRGITDFDKLLIKVQQGGFAGIGAGSTPIERALVAQRIATAAAGDAAVAMGQQIKQSVGEVAGAAVDGLTGKFRELGEVVRGVGQAAGSISVPQIAGAVLGAGTGQSVPSASGSGSGASMDVAAKDLSAAARTFLNAISGPESGGRYNIRYGGVGSPGKTFDSYDQHPAIYERTASGKRSSAAGRYQFTKETWDDYGGGDFSPARQDMAAWRLAQDRYRRNTGDDLEKELRTNGFSEKIVQALQGTWEALTTGAGAAKSRGIWNQQWNKLGDSNNVERDSGYTPRNPNDPKTPIPSTGMSEDEARRLDNWRKVVQKLNDQELNNNLEDEVKKLAAGWKEASEVADGYGKHVSALRKRIESGALGADKNPDAERYKEAMAAAAKFDEADKERVKNQAARARLAAGEERRLRDQDELEQRAASIRRQQLNDTNVDLSDSYYRRAAEMQRELEAARGLRDRGDKDWGDNRIVELESQQKATLAALRNQEVLEMQQAELRKTQAVERENLTQDQARQLAFDQEVQRQRALVAMTEEGSQARALAEANAIRRINAEREKLAQSSPITKQMKEWGSLSENFQKSMTGWLDSSMDGIAELVTTGKADFASLFQSIAKDITKMGLKFALSSMLGGGGFGKGAAGGAGKLAMSGGGAGKLFGAMHTGGIVGEGFSLSRFVSPSVFSGAPRFHSGGIIGSDEVPIIAQRGEGVFTAAQMKAMGGAAGSQVITIAPAVTVNASGGTPAQNADLAAQTAEAVKGIVRGEVVKELRSQLRPGNMLNQ